MALAPPSTLTLEQLRAHLPRWSSSEVECLLQINHLRSRYGRWSAGPALDVVYRVREAEAENGRA